MGAPNRLSAEIPDIFRPGFAVPENSGMTVQVYGEVSGGARAGGI